MGLFDKLMSGLGKTKEGFSEKLGLALGRSRKVTEEMFEELEEVLIESDMGVATSMEIVEKLRAEAKMKKITRAEDIKELLLAALSAILEKGNRPIAFEKGKLHVILCTGVNGVGKTTTIGKLAARLTGDGYKVLLCAADTFRAAAGEQLELWANRSGCDIIRHAEGADPGAVVFDAARAAQNRNYDVLMIDTAGRLQNKNNLMAELGKISRILDRELPQVPRENLLVLDASTGQNAISQAKSFKEIVAINGIVLTKIDGTAKGGIIVGIIDEMNIPVRYIGVGEGIDDLQDFDGTSFAKALFDDFKNEGDEPE